MYDDFASVYDTLMDDFDYDAWSAHYLTLIRTVTGELPRRAAECACGTGSLTVRLAQSGMAVTGVDLSAAMLRQAEKKARDYGVEVAFVRQDMKKLTLPRRVGAVLATCPWMSRSLFGKKMAAIDVFASSIISARTARKN